MERPWVTGNMVVTLVGGDTEIKPCYISRFGGIK